MAYFPSALWLLSWTLFVSENTGPVFAFSTGESAFLRHARRPTQKTIVYDSSISTGEPQTTSIKERLEEFVASTNRGRSVTDQDGESVEQLLEELDSFNEYKEPTRSPLTAGSWTVGYTTAPAPSNGQLGPFMGIAQQEINLDDKTYKNILIVPPNEWLKASLNAVWEEWDGELIQDDAASIAKWTGKEVTKQGSTNDNSEGTSENSVQNVEEKKPTGNKVDYGATCWRVTFEKLTISLFGTPIFTKQFDKGTERIWRTTYLDNDTRIVRAGRTGMPDDEMSFYMTRTKN
jgi:hypothetical protein